MKAAIFKSVGRPLVVEEVPDPKLLSTELMLKVEACGICGTDLHMSENENTEGGWRLLEPGCVLGHEFSGQIVEVGGEVEGHWKKDDRVTALPWIGCGTCAACIEGRPYRCPSVLMRASLELPGAYSEFCRVGAAEAVRLPDGVNFDEGALVEPLAVGLNAVRRANVKEEDTVFVMGAGPVGLCVALWCGYFGARHILISDFSGERRAAALKFGVTTTIDAGRNDVNEQILDHLGYLPKVIFDCVGLPGTLQTAIDYAAPDARIIVVGLCMQSDIFFPAKALLKELDIRFAYVYCRDDFETVIRLIDSKKIDPSSLISNRIDLTDFPITFEKLKKPGSDLKVMLKSGLS
ncbi:MAG: alcohol dehydrogenase [Magnetovibrio sp.]|nr:alcohol dehydrogenase [Magnetovibrio sp.]